MITIHDIALAFPDRQEQLETVADEISLSRNQSRMYGRFFGFDRFHCDHEEPLQPLVLGAADTVLKRNAALNDRLSHAVHCHTLLSTGVFTGRTSAVLQPFSERGIEVFSATMNHCATGVSALGMLDQLLGEAEAGLILIGEKAFHPAIREITNTTLMGEASAAVLVSREPGPYEVVGTHTKHDPRFWLNSGLRGENYLEGFQDAYLGFACDCLSEALQKFRLSMSDIRFVLPHNVNIPSWLQIAQRMEFDAEKIVLATIGKYGHCFGADPFINLEHIAQSGCLETADQVLLISIGLGSTASCALLRKT